MSINLLVLPTDLEGELCVTNTQAKVRNRFMIYMKQHVVEDNEWPHLSPKKKYQPLSMFEAL